VPAQILFTGVDAKVHGAVASLQSQQQRLAACFVRHIKVKLAKTQCVLKKVLCQKLKMVSLFNNWRLLGLKRKEIYYEVCKS
jgi:hypothetical protein